jgi:hypothetical protein
VILQWGCRKDCEVGEEVGWRWGGGGVAVGWFFSFLVGDEKIKRLKSELLDLICFQNLEIKEKFDSRQRFDYRDNALKKRVAYPSEVLLMT